MFSRFFIDRPIFAAVLSIVITLAGAVSLGRLPLAQYPTVTPPTVQVDCSYPGASSRVVAEAVAAPIEQQVNGVENMLYMASQCANDGSYNLTVTFKQGVNLHMAQVLVQNRVNLALPSLPEVIKRTGVTTRKRNPDILMTVNINSPNGRYDQLYLSNYATMHVREELARVRGVSDIYMQGQRDYSMRVWVDPDRLAARSLTAADVVAALREQNMQVAAGQIGQPPVAAGQKSQITLTTLGRLAYPEQFENVIVRATAEGQIVRLKDVARVELGARNQDVRCRLDRKQSVGLAVFQLPDANALETADRVRAKMEELAKDFPEGVIYEIQYDTTPYTRECINEVFKALQMAVLLVAFVVLLFLQNWRSAIIPLVAVPVAIFGTFGVMAALGFSLNNLTLFGLVLVIGIVVDDAIVVVEAVEHHIEQGFEPREATIRAMGLVSGPVLAMGLVLSSVFLPCAFITGITGQFFRQFALTIASSTMISTFNSLTLSPALAALLLRPRDKETHEPLPRLAFGLAGGWLGYAWLTPWLHLGLEWAGIRGLPAGVTGALPWVASLPAALLGWYVGRLLNAVLRWGFRYFDRGFTASIGLYLRGVEGLLRVTPVVLVIYAGLLVVTWWGFRHMPKGFIPTQDMGYLMVNIQLPDAAAAERTRQTVNRIETITLATPGVKHTLSVSGSSLLLNATGSHLAFLFVILDDFSNRRAPELYSDAIAARLRAAFTDQIPEARVTVLPAPPIRGIGRTGGLRMMVEDRGDLGPQMLQQQVDNLVDKGRRLPELVDPVSVFQANAPQLFADVNRSQCISMGVPLEAVFNTLQTYLGSLHVNDFNRFGRTWRVIVQADSKFRRQVDTIRQLKVRNKDGQMVPLGAVADIRQTNGPLVLTRYNMYPAAAINANAAPGVSSGTAISQMQALAGRELPAAMASEWTELAYLQLQAGNTAMVLFGLAVVMVFLVLAAQYESWSLPMAVILVVPMCLLSAIAGVAAARMDINIFTQVGFVVLVGLASKNAILIVEYAKRQRELGTPRHEAAMAACQLRLRPIVMTSAAFILGVSPLLFARGAGAEMRRTLGTAVFSGMLGVTLFGIFLTPVFFVVIDRLSQSGFFQSRPMRWLRGLSLTVFALGFLRFAARHAAGLGGAVIRRINNSQK
jgi:multidrug efflux pump subunit AcrB